jgi:phospholipid transport system substrate-binding protein
MKKRVSVLAALCLTAIFCRGDAQSETRTILSRTIDQGIAILKNKGTPDDEKLKAYDRLLTENCHTELMAMLALGRSGWSALSEAQRKEFVAAFLSVMTRSYYNKLNQVDLSHVAVEYGENVAAGDSKRTLRTVMKNSGEGFKVDYKFALRNGAWGIYDLEVEGISLIASYRSQFTDFLKSRSAAELLNELKSNNSRFDAESVVK